MLEERDKDGKGWEEATTKKIQSDVVKGALVWRNRGETYIVTRRPLS